ncbi:MAG: CDP-glycerol glycerophosphotransferase family protein, partial [Bifidobacteriaceae bacterium]|nr:CDP-glycerol glycerophosphotransferase family protein [Bifidobacteriaceae bacterium]
MNARLAAAWALRWALAVASAPLRALPRRRKVVMASREQSAVPEDFELLRAALARLDPGLKVVVSARGEESGVLGRWRFAAANAAQLWHAATARVLVLDTYSPAASLVRHGPGLRVVQMWHALGAFKRFGWSIVGVGPEGRDPALARATRMHAGYDVVVASSERCRGPFAEAFGVDPAAIEVAALPRVDLIVDPAAVARDRARLLERHPELGRGGVLLYAPTFRRDGPGSVDVGELARGARDRDLVLVYAPHPLELAGAAGSGAVSPAGRLAMDRAERAGAVVVRDFSTRELLAVADAFATDYSSSVFEAALAGVPCYFLAPDAEAYRTARGFYLDVPADLPGPLVDDAGALLDAVASGLAGGRFGEAAGDHGPWSEAGERAREWAGRWVEVPEGSAATKCADHLARIVLKQLGAACGGGG